MGERRGWPRTGRRGGLINVRVRNESQEMNKTDSRTKICEHIHDIITCDLSIIVPV